MLHVGHFIQILIQKVLIYIILLPRKYFKYFIRFSYLVYYIDSILICLILHWINIVGIDTAYVGTRFYH